MHQSIHTMYTPHTTHIGHLHVCTVIHDSTWDQYASLHLRISDAKHGHTSRGLARIVATHSRHLYSTHELSYQYTLHNALLTTSTNHTRTPAHTHAHTWRALARPTSRSHFGFSRLRTAGKGTAASGEGGEVAHVRYVQGGEGGEGRGAVQVASRCSPVTTPLPCADRLICTGHWGRFCIYSRRESEIISIPFLFLLPCAILLCGKCLL